MWLFACSTLIRPFTACNGGWRYPDFFIKLQGIFWHAQLLLSYVLMLLSFFVPSCLSQRLTFTDSCSLTPYWLYTYLPDTKQKARSTCLMLHQYLPIKLNGYWRNTNSRSRPGIISNAADAARLPTARVLTFAGATGVPQVFNKTLCWGGKSQGILM